MALRLCPNGSEEMVDLSWLLGCSHDLPLCRRHSTSGPAAGGAFLGGGVLSLMAMLAWIWTRLVVPVPSDDDQLELSLLSLASTSIRRNPLRSVLAIGLIGIASLLILSISLFHIAPSDEGTGGFSLIAQSTLPIMKDLGDPAYHREVAGARGTYLNACMFASMRVRDGDDAGCSNLYQATQPRILGVSTRLALFDAGRFQRNSFAWAGQVRPKDDTERLSKWYLLERVADGSKEKTTASHPG